MLLSIILVMSLFSTLVFAEDTTDTTLSVVGATGSKSQTVTVAVRIDDSKSISGANIKIKYDKRLELISSENGDFFVNMSSSAIYAQDTLGVNGEYTYIGLNDGGNTNGSKGTLVKLTFKIPDDAQVGDKYTVEIDKKQSLLATGVDSSIDYVVKKDVITVIEGEECSHTFGEYVVIGTTGYFSTGYKYRQCTSCNVVETEYTPATAINAFEYLGTSMNYTGKPSGIAPMYKVNMVAIDEAKSNNPDCKVDAGIIVYKDGKVYEEEVFYGEGATYKLVDDILFVKLTNVSAYDKFVFKAYVKITNEATGEERIAYNVATVKGNEEISICDVVKCLNLKDYSKETKVYLQNILDGFAE